MRCVVGIAYSGSEVEVGLARPFGGLAYRYLKVEPGDILEVEVPGTPSYHLERTAYPLHVRCTVLDGGREIPGRKKWFGNNEGWVPWDCLLPLRLDAICDCPWHWEVIRRPGSR